MDDVDVVVKTFTFAISSPDEFLVLHIMSPRVLRNTPYSAQLVSLLLLCHTALLYVIVDATVLLQTE